MSPNALNLVVALVNATLAGLASGHAILYKRDSRAAVAWVGLVWLVPFVGSVLYWLLGVNRIRRTAVALRAPRVAAEQKELVANNQRDLLLMQAPSNPQLAPLAEAGARLAGRELVLGCSVDILQDGDAAYPAMLAAIDEAERSIALSTYIFDNDTVGRRFAQALQRAHERGVAVRVLIDAIGARYSYPTMVRQLRQRRVPVAAFLPARFPFFTPLLNLRNHRKLLVADGEVAFVGGINIRQGHVLGERPAHPVRDLHFRVSGPVVRQLLACFVDDWRFTTGEQLEGDRWYPELRVSGEVAARAVLDGPDEDFDVIRRLLLAALASARHSVRVMTPYFVPDSALVMGLSTAALRGVQVDILVPARSNIRVAQWASMALLWQVLKYGCRVHQSLGVFDHSKLVIVDDCWVLVGSANWDARSLRLNFELELECYSEELAGRLLPIWNQRIEQSRRVDLAEVDGRSLPVRLRDGVARLLSPYL